MKHLLLTSSLISLSAASFAENRQTLAKNFCALELQVAEIATTLEPEGVRENWRENWNGCEKNTAIRCNENEIEILTKDQICMIAVMKRGITLFDAADQCIEDDRDSISVDCQSRDYNR